jgi:hypothetical protein
MGVIQAIISRCECDTQERIRHIVAGERSFVFLLKEPLYLLMITTNNVPIQFLRRQLECAVGFVLLCAALHTHTSTARTRAHSRRQHDHKLREPRVAALASTRRRRRRHHHHHHHRSHHHNHHSHHHRHP